MPLPAVTVTVTLRSHVGSTNCAQLRAVKQRGVVLLGLLRGTFGIAARAGDASSALSDRSGASGIKTDGDFEIV